MTGIRASGWLAPDGTFHPLKRGEEHMQKSVLNRIKELRPVPNDWLLVRQLTSKFSLVLGTISALNNLKFEAATILDHAGVRETEVWHAPSPGLQDHLATVNLKRLVETEWRGRFDLRRHPLGSVRVRPYRRRR